MALFRKILEGTAGPRPSIADRLTELAQQHPEFTALELEAYLTRPPIWELN